MPSTKAGMLPVGASLGDPQRSLSHTLPNRTGLLALFSSFFCPQEPPRRGSIFAPLAPGRAQRSIQSRELDAPNKRREKGSPPSIDGHESFFL